MAPAYRQIRLQDRYDAIRLFLYTFTPATKTPPEAVYGPYRKVLNLFQKRKRI